ncbi:hypothetical protein NAT51_09225 [Flavobacterium amniphilum]|uniref:hypothetical protein n=1 Tax=Flavobacterium amniphilum TaxID=1834035 RepID=UPI00202A95A8|nr:hypothetical protein [Flavobacterium amniphilum]MCL9805703.1 hypothetical protein [Flavobacterium amniphilum]
MKLFNKQSELNEGNISFYAHIGLISIRFAELESLITHIIERLINSDNDIVSSTLIENNNLSTNLQLLKKINRCRRYEEEKISETILKINQLRDMRNFFIHGVWSDVKIDEEGTYVQCSNHKHIYEKNSSGQLWTRYHSEQFRLKDFQEEIKKIDAVLVILKELWEDLEEEDFL